MKTDTDIDILVEEHYRRWIKGGTESVKDAMEALAREATAQRLTVRDQIAASALPAIYEHQTKLTDLAARLAYEQADAMMKARDMNYEGSK